MWRSVINRRLGGVRHFSKSGDPWLAPSEATRHHGVGGYLKVIFGATFAGFGFVTAVSPTYQERAMNFVGLSSPKPSEEEVQGAK